MFLKPTMLKQSLLCFFFALLTLGVAQNEAAPIVAIATFQANEGSEADLATSMADLIRQTEQLDNPSVYAAFQSVDTPTQFFAYEIWPDQETLERHLSAEHFTEAIEAMTENYMQAPLEGQGVVPLLPLAERATLENLLPPNAVNSEQVYSFTVLRAQPGQETTLAQLLTDYGQTTLEQDGPLVYEVFQGSTDPTVFYGFEVWSNTATLEAHQGAEHSASFAEAAGDLLAAPSDVQRVQPLNPNVVSDSGQGSN
jgi:quinol monooxygenase YgiN